jgi:hypothetical protein
MSLKQQDEITFYKKLAKLLVSKNFSQFNKHIEKLNQSFINFNPQNIPNRFEILRNLLVECIIKVTREFHVSSLGDFIEILKFFNKFNLLDRELTFSDLDRLHKIKEDYILLSNLTDLFGDYTNSFIFFINNDLPRLLYNLLYEDFTELQFYSSWNPEDFVNYVKFVFFNHYSIYGLSVKYLGTVKQFIHDINKNYLFNRNNFGIKSSKFENDNLDLIEFDKSYKDFSFYETNVEEREYFAVKKHLVSVNNIFKNQDKIISNDNYKFYSISMVLSGGVGPQGMGFTYSTPRGELIEICSDIKENEAIIVKYKEFLKEQFLKRLNSELTILDVGVKKKIIDYLSSVLNPKELINYLKKERIISQIKIYLSKLEAFQTEKIYKKLIYKISNSISKILRPIKMIDQFKARMKLVNDGKLKSEDIAKLTSLKNKSHYDILRERLFFQYVVDWFYDIYIENKE